MIAIEGKQDSDARQKSKSLTDTGKNEGEPMGKKDTKAKEYLADNERFADLCNVVLFDGEQVIRAENQAEIHYAMPVKSALYDVLNYGSQVKELAKKHKEAGDQGSGGEFLSGFHRDDWLTPVITITVYWGSDEWDAPRSLHEMFGQFDERLKSFIPDYRINLIVPGEMENFDKFQTELGSVLEAIKVSADKNSMGKLFREDKRFSAMSNESVEAINTFVGTNITVNKQEGVTDVNKEWEDWISSKQAEGRTEERRKTIRRMLSKDRTPEEIADLCGYDLAEIEAVEKEMFTPA